MNQANANALIAANVTLARIKSLSVATAVVLLRVNQPLFHACVAPLIQRETREFITGYLVAAHASVLFDNVKDTAMIDNVDNTAMIASASLKMVALFESIVHTVGAGGVPETADFVEAATDFMTRMENWKATDGPRVCLKIETCLRNLYAEKALHAATVPEGVTSTLADEYDHQITRLRTQLRRLGGEAREIAFNPITVREQIAAIDAIHGDE